MLLWLFAAYALGLYLVQADFDIVFEDVDCPTFDEEYIKECDFELNYDSTYGSSVDANIEIIKQFPDDVKVVADVFTVRMGEYNVNVGIHLDTGFCDVAADANGIGMSILRAVNMDSGPCPPPPGIYQREGFVMDNMDGLPPSFPAGHYLLNMTFMSQDTALAIDAVFFKNDYVVDNLIVDSRNYKYTWNHMLEMYSSNHLVQLHAASLLDTNHGRRFNGIDVKSGHLYGTVYTHTRALNTFDRCWEDIANDLLTSIVVVSKMSADTRKTCKWKITSCCVV